MKTKYIYITFLLVITFFVSCSYLDKAESGGMTLDQVFGDLSLAEEFLTAGYARIPNDYSTYFANASDEAKAPQSSFAENQINSGVFSPSGNAYNNWTFLYNGLRHVNIFLQEINSVPVSSTQLQNKKNRMLGEGHFLRAYLYFDLFRRWGAVPIVTEPLDVNTEEWDIPRDSLEDVISFIVSECENAAELLPVRHQDINLGRATKGAAMALKARALLYFASELHNPENDIQRWNDAAKAAKDIISLDLYELDDNYKKMFNTRTSPEIIFQNTSNYTDFTLHMLPPSQGGQARITPLQNLIDDYEMNNGLLPIINEGGVRKINPDSGYDPANPYINRDPRFYMSILYNGSKWRDSDIYTYKDAPEDGIDGGYNNTPTGYYLAKLVDEESSRKPTVITGNNFWIYFRYSEVLLNYAEALNETLASPNQDVHDAINLIRERPGVDMPKLSMDLTKDKMREAIRHERRIELAFEGHRFFDMRRWRIASKVMPNAFGMRAEKNSDGSFKYTHFLLENRVYYPHFDLFPIMQTELNRNKGLKQNPGYN